MYELCDMFVVSRLLWKLYLTVCRAKSFLLAPKISLITSCGLHRDS